MPYVKANAYCPKCKKTRATGEDEIKKKFGWRKNKKDEKIAQSWCKKCRAKYPK